MSKPQEKEQQSETAKALSARLYAVQAVYQIMQNATPVKAVLQQYLDKAEDMEIDGEKIVTPNG
ncbi:MAG: transcription antitermination protein NusB, partial [Pseudomonadota bacterium]